MKKVLIVTYYWPPAGGPSVQRVLKFAKYLPEFGWQPIVLTVHKGEYFAIDPTLNTEIQNIPTYRSFNLEPGSLYRKMTGMRPEEPIPVSILEKPSRTFMQKITHGIRRNLFIPDAKIGWFPFAIHKGKQVIHQEKPELIFSTSPPPTVHLIAARLAHKFQLPFVADFRDPWTAIYYYQLNPRWKCTEKMDRMLERRIMRQAHHLTFTTRLDVEFYQARYHLGNKCTYIPNGYDEEDFQNIQIENTPEQFIIAHMGSLNYSRIPIELFQALKTAIANQEVNPHHIRLQLIGNVDEAVKAAVDNYHLTPLVEYVGYLPHRQALQLAARASVLLLVNFKSQVSKKIIPGKLFEYLRLRKPIFAISPSDGEVARILNNIERSYVADFDQTSPIYSGLIREYNYWQSGDFINPAIPPAVKQYDRKILTNQLAQIFNNALTSVNKEEKQI